MEGAARAQRKRQRRLVPVMQAAVLGTGEVLARPPVVADLVVVPLRQHRDFGVERQEIAIQEIVFVVAAVLREHLGGPRLFLGDEIASKAWLSGSFTSAEIGASA